jgi:hypothetical protein
MTDDVVKTGTYLVTIMVTLYQAIRVYVSEHVILHSHRLQKANIQGKENELSRDLTQFYIHSMSSVINIRNKSSITANNLKGKENSIYFQSKKHLIK